MKYRLGDITVKHWNDWDRVPRDPTMIGFKILGSLGIMASSTVAFAVGYIATTLVTSWALRALAPKPSFGGAGSRGLLVNSREATAPQQIVYGEIRKGGTVTFIESTGDTNQYLHQVIALAGHEVNSIGDIYINDEVVTLDGDGFVTDAKWDSKIRIKKHTGADNQTADSDLVSETSVTSDFKGQGIAYIYVRMEYDQDVFAEGIPLFTAKVQGKKVYDPRTSSTGYSANAALCIRDYLVSGYGLDNAGDVNDAYFQAAANTCDESVTLAGSGTESRYEINGVIFLDQTPSDILGDMMTACAGTLFWGQGEWHLKVGEYTSPIKTFTLDDLRGAINLDTKHSRRDNFNIVRGSFTDAGQGFIRADYPEIRSSSFITDDNGIESALDLALPLTTSSATAQRLAKMTLFRAREQMTFTADFGLEAFEVECGDIISLTIDRYGWSAKEFEVVGWKFRNDGDAGDLRVALTLRETSSAAFSWTAEESDITGNDSTLTNPSSNLSVSNVTVTDKGNIQQDGTFVGQALVSWTKATNKFVSHYEVQWKDVDETVYQTTTTDGENGSVIIGPLETGTQYNVQVRAVTVSGIRGAFAAASLYTHGGDSTAPSPVTSLSATGGPKIVTLDWTAPTTDSDASTLYDLKGYNIYRNTIDSQPASPAAFSGSDKYVDGGLAASTTYYFWVTAIDYSGNESTAVASGAVTTEASAVNSDTRIYTGKVYYQTLQETAPATPSAYGPELISNGTFDTDTTGWSGNVAATLSVVSNELQVTSSGTSYPAFAYQGVTTTIGEVYRLVADVNYTSDDGLIRVGTVAGSGNLGESGVLTSDQTVVIEFTATSTTSYIRVGLNSAGDAQSIAFDNISVKEASVAVFNEATASFTSLPTGWAETQPRVDATSTVVKEWSSNYKVQYDVNDNETITFSTPDGAFQITDDLESDNYITGTSGWRIERDTGNAEFQNATIRGTLNASDITAGTLNIARLPGIGVAGTTTANSSVIGDTDITVSFSDVAVGSSMMVVVNGSFASGTASSRVTITPVASGASLDHTQTIGGFIDQNANIGPTATHYGHVATSIATSTSGTIGFNIAHNNASSRIYYKLAVSLLTFKA